MQPTTYPSVIDGEVARPDIGRSSAALIVDAHPLYRAGLMWALAPLPIRCREAGTLMAAIDALERESVDLILYDWHLPDGGGCKGLAAISRLAAQVPVIVISADQDEAIDVAARCMGAVGRITKAQDAAWVRAVVSRAHLPPGGPKAGEPPRGAANEVSVGALYRSDDAAATDATFEAGSPASRIELTQRQHQVLRQMASGQPNKRIATALGIADSTVRAHVSEILRLMHARNRTEAVVRAQRERVLALGGS